MRFGQRLLWMLAVFPCAAWAQVPVGLEFRVNTYTTGAQEDAAVASDAQGNFVVVWTSNGQDGHFAGVFGQRYDAAGAPRGVEFQVNTVTTYGQSGPSVASDAQGNVVVVWTNDLRTIKGQRYNATGAPRGGEFQVNTTASNFQAHAAAASDSQGNSLVVWTNSNDSSSDGVVGQLYNSSGGVVGAEFRVNTYSTSTQNFPAVAADGMGNFVVVWQSSGQDGSLDGVFGRRFNAAGNGLGAEFRVNTYTTGFQRRASVSADAQGNFVVAWQSPQDGGLTGVFAQRYDAAGAPLGGEFQVNTFTSSYQRYPAVDMDPQGRFQVTWESEFQDGSGAGIFARRYQPDGTPQDEFRVNTSTQFNQIRPAIAVTQGGALIAWTTPFQDGSDQSVYGQLFGGLTPAALAVDAGGNSVFEPGETIIVSPSWRNNTGIGQSLTGAASNFTGTVGATYTIVDGSADYGTIADGAAASCVVTGDCYSLTVSVPPSRPVHWDSTVQEDLSLFAQSKIWSLHLGESFTDVPKTSPFYRFVETLLHNGITGGCGAGAYCPASAVTREQIAPFVLVAKEGTAYAPFACTTPMFGDVPATSPFCRWIEELARRGVVGGCGGGNYCPASAVTREQMPVFVLRTLDPSLDPPACTTPVFGDVPASSPFCRWIEELVRRGVVTGCGGGNYCPAAPVTREQMGVFLSVTFGLTLYGP